MSNIDKDAIGLYLKDISKYPILSPEEEQQTANIMLHSEDEEARKQARNKLVVSNLRFAFKCAKEYYKTYGRNYHVKMTLMDFVAEANKGMMRSAYTYDPAKGRFCTYAFHGIRSQIVLALRSSSLIRMPCSHFTYYPRLLELRLTHGNKLTDDMIKEELEIDDDMLKKLKDNDKLLVSSVDNEIFEETYADVREVPGSDIDNRELKQYLLDMLSTLSERDRHIMYRRFFSNRTVTLDELGKELNITRERVRQIIMYSLRKLRRRITEDRAFRDLKISRVAKGSENERDESAPKKGPSQ